MAFNHEHVYKKGHCTKFILWHLIMNMLTKKVTVLDLYYGI